MNGLFPTPSNYLLHVCARALHHCALFALLLCAAARAAAPDSAPPIYLQADAWTYDDLKQVSVLTGHVVITQGAMVIRGERVILRQDPEGYQYMSSFAGNGARASFRQKREGVNEYIEGFAEQIDYDGKSDVTTLLRRAQVRRLLGRAQVLDEVRGNLIRYDAKQALYSARASADNTRPDSSGGRVRAMLSAPKEQAPMRRLSTP